MEIEVRNSSAKPEDRARLPSQPANVGNVPSQRREGDDGVVAVDGGGGGEVQVSLNLIRILNKQIEIVSLDHPLHPWLSANTPSRSCRILQSRIYSCSSCLCLLVQVFGARVEEFAVDGA